MYVIVRMTEHDCGLGVARDAHERHHRERGRQAVLFNTCEEIVLPQLLQWSVPILSSISIRYMPANTSICLVCMVGGRQGCVADEIVERFKS